jgi:two-component system chemotaxis response regulator CheY
MYKILIVEDSKSMRMMIKATLSGKYELTEAEDGLVGLNYTLSNKYDCIISDVNMPNMTGIELTTNVRKPTNINSKTPILILTTETSSDIKEKGKVAGATGWIVKPFTPEKLLSVVDRVIC